MPNSATSNLGGFIRYSEKRLAAGGIDNPALDARLLIAHALGLDRAQLLAQSERALSERETGAAQALIERRAQREPVSRILGSREFWGLNFGLNEATLDPRPESETLVETVLQLVRIKPSPLEGEVRRGGHPHSHFSDFQDQTNPHAPSPNPSLEGRGTFLRILDLGTGTGCLLLALLHEMPDATGLGIDIAPRAVEQAQKNAGQLGLSERAVFRPGNWLEGVTEKFDIVVSNPPYIAACDIPGLIPEVRAHDPKAALDGGEDGLDPYRLLIPQLPHFLNPGGTVAFEVGQGQAQAVAALLQKENFSGLTIKSDLGGIPRCVCARK